MSNVKLFGFLLVLVLFFLPACVLLAQESPGGEESRREEERAVLEERAREEALARAETTYDPEGRRDPFIPLIGVRTTEGPEESGLTGLRSLLIEEVKLVGIYIFDEETLATFQGGPENKGYSVREGDEFRNGKVIEISYPEKKVVVRQEIKDPRSLKKYQDQTIRLHPLAGEEVKR